MHPVTLALRATTTIVLIGLLTSCGGSGTSTTPTPAPSGSSGIAGTYQIVQRAVETTCGDTGTPATVNGTVTTTAGSDAFVLRDTGGTTFNGTVQANGQFTANAVFGPDANGQTFTQRLEGSFTSTGFTARLSVDVQPRNCRFTRDWIGTKQS
jgi:uncharacterized protein YdeI (BOF family)